MRVANEWETDRFSYIRHGQILLEFTMSEEWLNGTSNELNKFKKFIKSNYCCYTKRNHFIIWLLRILIFVCIFLNLSPYCLQLFFFIWDNTTIVKAGLPGGGLSQISTPIQVLGCLNVPFESALILVVSLSSSVVYQQSDVEDYWVVTWNFPKFRQISLYSHYHRIQKSVLKLNMPREQQNIAYMNLQSKRYLMQCFVLKEGCDTAIVT